MKKRLIVILAVFFLFTALAPSEIFATIDEFNFMESVYIYQIDSQDPYAAIVRQSGETYLVEYTIPANSANITTLAYDLGMVVTCYSRGADFADKGSSLQLLDENGNPVGQAEIVDSQYVFNLHDSSLERIPLPEGGDLNANHERYRLYGDTRYITSAMAAVEGWETSDYAVIVSGENYPDAITATPLALQFEAPILLSQESRLPEHTGVALWILGVSKAIIIGGEEVLYDNVRLQLERMGIETARIGGNDRYETSVLIALALVKVADTPITEAVFVPGNDFANALTVSPYAAKSFMPILLTPQNYLPDSIYYYLAATDIENSYVVATEDEISSAVMNQLPGPQRISGKDKYDTCLKLADAFPGRISLAHMVLATGSNYPDALSGAALASKLAAPILLLNNNTVDEGIKNFIIEYKDFTTKSYVLGGEQVLPTDLINSYYGL